MSSAYKKRVLSDGETLSGLKYDDFASNAALKRRRIFCASPFEVKHSGDGQNLNTRRVSFSTPLERQIIIPPMDDPAEKARLFYSNKDFELFAFSEKIRRDAFILTLALYREQNRRLRNRIMLIPPIAIQKLYHTVISRIRRWSPTEHNLEDNQEPSTYYRAHVNESHKHLHHRKIQRNAFSDSHPTLNLLHIKETTHRFKRHVVVASCA